MEFSDVLRDVPLLARRMIEGQMLGQVYETTRAAEGREKALATVVRAVEAAATEAGRAFAAVAPKGPCFEHFKTILALWKHGGALTIEHVHDTDSHLTFSVTRCLYVEAYRALGIPAELVSILSCARDAPFAAAYHPALEFDRPCTIGEGAEAENFFLTEQQRVVRGGTWLYSEPTTSYRTT
ncbi:MAG: L-2-amino-thiazoline-4-carboxylic acid hydrolase, partial [Desulfovibrionaceae bacterium]|nr:L-2-amino-thiazoline-4-carboxylic acid hydrolase [Desulfovibrionaceae bacterium]